MNDLEKAREARRKREEDEKRRKAIAQILERAKRLDW